MAQCLNINLLCLVQWQEGHFTPLPHFPCPPALPRHSVYSAHIYYLWTPLLVALPTLTLAFPPCPFHLSPLSAICGDCKTTLDDRTLLGLWLSSQHLGSCNMQDTHKFESDILDMRKLNGAVNHSLSAKLYVAACKLFTRCAKTLYDAGNKYRFTRYLGNVTTARVVFHFWFWNPYLRPRIGGLAAR